MNMNLDLSMRDKDALHAAAMLSRFPLEIADIVCVTVPEGLDRTEQVAYLMAYFASHMASYNVVENPARFVQRVVEDAANAGHPYHDDLQEALALHGIAKCRFWYNQKESTFTSLLTHVLLDATEHDLGEVRTRAKTLVAEIDLDRMPELSGFYSRLRYAV